MFCLCCACSASVLLCDVPVFVACVVLCTCFVNVSSCCHSFFVCSVFFCHGWCLFVIVCAPIYNVCVSCVCFMCVIVFSYCVGLPVVACLLVCVSFRVCAFVVLRVCCCCVSVCVVDGGVVFVVVCVGALLVYSCVCFVRVVLLSVSMCFVSSLCYCIAHKCNRVVVGLFWGCLVLLFWLWLHLLVCSMCCCFVWLLY